MKDFDTFVGSLKTNPDAVIAGLEGLKPTLEAVQRSGETYHRRIVEGAPAGGGAGGGAGAAFKAPEGAPPAKGVADGKVLYDKDHKPVAVAKGGQWTAPTP